MPRTIPGPRFCEICGSPLQGYQLRFCSVEHQLRWLHAYRPALEKKNATLKAMVAAGEMPKPPRAAGPFKHADPELRAAMRFVKKGGRIADLPPRQRELFRAYNREHQRLLRARARTTGAGS